MPRFCQASSNSCCTQVQDYQNSADVIDLEIIPPTKANTTSPDPGNYGWEMKDDQYVPIKTDQLPAPDAVIQMSLCKCRTGCNTMRCKCYKNQLGCTEMCLCANCENNGDESDKFWSDDQETDDMLQFFTVRTFPFFSVI